MRTALLGGTMPRVDFVAALHAARRALNASLTAAKLRRGEPFVILNAYASFIGADRGPGARC